MNIEIRAFPVLLKAWKYIEKRRARRQIFGYSVVFDSVHAQLWFRMATIFCDSIENHRFVARWDGNVR